MLRLGMFSSFFYDRSIVVEVDVLSTIFVFWCASGLYTCNKQPSTLFFPMFIEGLCLSIRFAKFQFYADDLHIYLSGVKKDLS
jgi:hypothetical protein